jgi:hypothetical protein
MHAVSPQGVEEARRGEGYCRESAALTGKVRPALLPSELRKYDVYGNSKNSQDFCISRETNMYLRSNMYHLFVVLRTLFFLTQELAPKLRYSLVLGVVHVFLSGVDNELAVNLRTRLR